MEAGENRVLLLHTVRLLRITEVRYKTLVPFKMDQKLNPMVFGYVTEADHR